MHSVTDFTIKTPPRTTSLRFREIIQQTSTTARNSSILSMFDEDSHDEFEDIDLNAPSSSNDITLENMSSMIAAAIQLSSTSSNRYFRTRRLSSLSAGNASIIYDKKKKKNNNRLSSLSVLLFNDKKKDSFPPTTTTTDTVSTAHKPSAFGCYHYPINDGKEELIYRGIRVQEIKSTRKPMVVPVDYLNPFPKIQLQRPQFAHVNY
ncbi:MAG: hypothetical protein EXX96DRAFT_568747 [Benjaminiella poitrasii]|nr:MAG: hypothetical protein EXX96DRAFT_568747 [Benjaminiella poitrasii]